MSPQPTSAWDDLPRATDGRSVAATHLDGQMEVSVLGSPVLTFTPEQAARLVGYLTGHLAALIREQEQT